MPVSVRRAPRRLFAVCLAVSLTACGGGGGTVGPDGEPIDPGDLDPGDTLPVNTTVRLTQEGSYRIPAGDFSLGLACSGEVDFDVSAASGGERGSCDDDFVSLDVEGPGSVRLRFGPEGEVAASLTAFG